MKRSKRQENSIIIYFSFYFILLLALIIFSFSVLYPKITDIEDKKNTTNDTYLELEKLTDKGLSYQEFKKLSGGSALNSYQKELINSVDVNFYNESFKNDGKDSYLKFLEEKKKSLNNQEEKDKFEEKVNQIIKLLPPYSETDISGENNLLSDFKFINYIENILETFSLEYSNEIGITELQLLEEFSETGKKSKLDTDIYFIPLSLSIEGTKYNIINFLYFVENVGNIKISENSLQIHNQNDDKFLHRGEKGVKILLKSDQPVSSNYTKSFIDNYNIFENQLINIENIKFGEYLDSLDRPLVREGTSIANRVKNTQGNEKIKIDLELHFYVKGIQNIKIIDHLKLYLDYFAFTKKIITTELKNKNIDTRQKNMIQAMQTDLNEMSKKLKDINISISKQENLNDRLKEVTNYTNILHNMHSKIGFNVYIKGFLVEYKKLLGNKKLQESNISLYSYLEEITNTVNGLKQTDSESLDSYNTRLNNKKIFQNVLQIQKNIDLKK